MRLSQKKSSNLIGVFVASGLGSVVAVGGILCASGFFSTPESSFESMVPSSFEGCNVLGLQVHGTIVATRSQIPVTDMLSSGDQYGTILTPNYAVANQLIDTLDWASTDENIKAIIIDVDSPGGAVAASDEVAQAIRRVGKPTVAVIHDLGTSGGYLVAAAAHNVYAGLGSTVGSIAATYSFLDQSEKNKKEGYAYEQLSSGAYKDMLRPDKPLTEDERALITRDLNILHSDFINSIALYRELPREHVEKLADGSTFLGSQALNEGLIDSIGGVREATDSLFTVLGEPTSVCWR